MNTGKNDEQEKKKGKSKKSRAERAVYRMDVEEEKTKGTGAGNKADLLSDLPTPLAHDALISYVFFFFHPRPHASTN
jgi:hypothetical protein